MLANLLIISGFFLLVAGFSLRTVMMMRSSDTTAAQDRVLHGRELLRQYRKSFPHSTAPLLTRGMLIAGTLLLLAGLAAEFSR